MATKQRRLTALVGLCFCLSACATAQKPTATPPSGVTLPPPVAPPPNVEPTPPPPPPEPPALEEKDLVNLSAAKLRSMFGEPSFIRQEPESEMWRYDLQNCAAFFFLYRTGADLAVRHAETLPRTPNGGLDAECMKRLSARFGTVS